jgi:phospholipid/cholesterol/gamma-HCH transport system substrate-binding protein
MKVLRNPLLWGMGALVMVTVVALVATALYIHPPGQKIVTFYTDDAASVRPGDEVRIAGITVGKVQDLALEANQVRIRARVDDDAFVGNQSQVQVRMLTVVGGYYVNLVSLGDTALGANPIPVERVTMPYSLIQTLADATKITDNIHPTPIKESLDEVQKGLAGTNIESLSAVIDAGNALFSTIDKQRGQLSAILDMSDEYIRSLKDFGDELKQIVRKVSILEQTLVVYSKGFGVAITGVADILQVLGAFGEFYTNHRDKVLEKIRDWQAKARYWDDRAGVIIRTVRLMRNKLERVLDAQNAPPELLATDLCIPVPGSPC